MLLPKWLNVVNKIYEPELYHGHSMSKIKISVLSIELPSFALSRIQLKN